ncbi:MAG: hypothetical protein H0V47_01150 [Chloroflexia bacterium]|nr:hypothetical protein [Chloroflexia bacterium]
MLQDRPAKTRSEPAAMEGTKLDEEARAVLTWLLDVCARSTSSEEQVFIFRDYSRLKKALRRDNRGEVKAVGMSDLLRVHTEPMNALRSHNFIQLRKGRWPGKWFTVNFKDIS